MEKPDTPDAYLAAQPPERRARLEEIRATIRALAPDATEELLYGLPGFRLGRAQLAAYGAFTKHDGFYPCSGRVISEHPDVIARFATSRGAVQFPLDAPVPTEVVTALVRTRLAHLAAS